MGRFVYRDRDRVREGGGESLRQRFVEVCGEDTDACVLALNMKYLSVQHSTWKLNVGIKITFFYVSPRSGRV